MALELDKMTRLPGDEAFRREASKRAQWNRPMPALSFMRRNTRDLAGVDIAVTGIPFDQAVSTGRARFGPKPRKASAENAWGRFGPGCSILQYPALLTTAMLLRLGGKTSRKGGSTCYEIIGSGAEMVSLGGDHYITYPLLKAHFKHGPLALVHSMPTATLKSMMAASMRHHVWLRGARRPHRSAQIRADEIRTLTSGHHGLPHCLCR
jgi:agmatinase